MTLEPAALLEVTLLAVARSGARLLPPPSSPRARCAVMPSSFAAAKSGSVVAADQPNDDRWAGAREREDYHSKRAEE
jgi:hypothetical protein